MDLTPQSSTMRISELERLSGLSRDTIRYYERIGLLASPPRSGNGYRSYDAHTADILKFIELAQQIGFHWIKCVRPCLI